MFEREMSFEQLEQLTKVMETYEKGFTKEELAMEIKTITGKTYEVTTEEAQEFLWGWIEE